jgi:hypothetical protein
MKSKRFSGLAKICVLAVLVTCGAAFASSGPSGWLALWIMIWGTSIWRLECSNRSTTRSARGCYLCSRYIL